jgi:hypothetical protein
LIRRSAAYCKSTEFSRRRGRKLDNADIAERYGASASVGIVGNAKYGIRHPRASIFALRPLRTLKL